MHATSLAPLLGSLLAGLLADKYAVALDASVMCP